MINIELLIVITDRKISENFVRLYLEHTIPFSFVALGRGTASQEILDTLGLEGSEKSILFSLCGSEKANSIVKEIKKTLGIQNPGTSIVLTVPLNSIFGANTSRYITENQTIKRNEYKMNSDDEFELVIAVTTEGYSDKAMEAARTKGGATGGTILHARGLGMEEIKKFFGIAISDEKEVLLIACRSKCRNKIMQSIVDETANSQKPVVFSVPVSSTAGLWTLR